MKIIFSFLILLDVVQYGSAILDRKQALPKENPITDTSTLNDGVCNLTGNDIKNLSKNFQRKKLQSHLFLITNFANF